MERKKARSGELFCSLWNAVLEPLGISFASLAGLLPLVCVCLQPACGICVYSLPVVHLFPDVRLLLEVRHVYPVCGTKQVPLEACRQCV